jgi:hypothetical protein
MSGRRERQRAPDAERERAVLQELRRAAARRRWAEQADEHEARLAREYAYVPPPPPLIPEPPLLLSRRLETDPPLPWDPEGTQDLPLVTLPVRQLSWQAAIEGGDRAAAHPTAPRHHAPGAWSAEMPVRTDRTLTALLAGVLVAVVGAVTAVTWILLQRDWQRAPSAGQSRPQQTLLVLLTDERRSVLGTAVLGTGTTGADAVLAPSGLQLDVPGQGRTSLTKALSASTGAPAEALSNALGVRIDGTWVLSTAGMRSLVDSLGGVAVELEQPIDDDGARVATDTSRQLDGEQATAAAGGLQPGELEAAQLARFQAVLSGVLSSLSDDRQVLSAQIAALGQQTSTTLPAQQLTALLLALHQSVSGWGVDGTVVPMRAPSDGSAGAMGVDEVRASALVSRRLPGARLPVPPVGVVQVLVRNGVGTPGLSAVARSRLEAAGLRYTGGGSAPSFGPDPTAVLVPTGSAADQDRGRAVARALGVPDGSVRQDAVPAAADVMVVLGDDFAAGTDQSPSSVMVSASRP